MDIEIARYSDRLEVISPGALPNSMTIEKMKAGRRTPRNPVIMEAMRDYGYVDARGMGVRTKVIPLTRQFFGTDPQFESGDDYLKIILSGSLTDQHVPENVPEKDNSELVLSLISANPSITYDDLARQTNLNRKTVQRIIQDLKIKGHLERIGSARKGYWRILSNQEISDKSCSSDH